MMKKVGIQKRIIYRSIMLTNRIKFIKKDLSNKIKALTKEDKEKKFSIGNYKKKCQLTT